MNVGKKIIYILSMRCFGNIDALEREVADIMGSTPPDEIIVDLKGVTFLVSSALTQIVRLFKFARKNSVPFKVVNAGDLYDTFMTLKLVKLFEVSR